MIRIAFKIQFRREIKVSWNVTLSCGEANYIYHVYYVRDLLDLCNRCNGFGEIDGFALRAVSMQHEVNCLRV